MSTIRTIMNARGKQRKTSLAVQGFKCHEIGHKRYTDLKRKVTDLESLIKSKKYILYEKVLVELVRRHKEEITEYEKKNNINTEPEKVVEKKPGLMKRVMSIFSKKRR